jgi:hypothetical protein
VLWAREVSEGFFGESAGEMIDYVPTHGEILVHGHTPLQSEDFAREGFDQKHILDRGSSINIDTGCFLRLGTYQRQQDLKGNLAAFCLEDKTALYAYTILSDEVIENAKSSERKTERANRLAKMLIEGKADDFEEAINAEIKASPLYLNGKNPWFYHWLMRDLFDNIRDGDYSIETVYPYNSYRDGYDYSIKKSYYDKKPDAILRFRWTFQHGYQWDEDKESIKKQCRSDAYQLQRPYFYADYPDIRSCKDGDNTLLYVLDFCKGQAYMGMLKCHYEYKQSLYATISS